MESSLTTCADERYNSLVNTALYTNRSPGAVHRAPFLGPHLWNLIFDNLLMTLDHAGHEAVAYADDLIILVHASSRRELETRGQNAATMVEKWCQKEKLTISAPKSELILLKGKLDIKREKKKALREEKIREWAIEWREEGDEWTRRWIPVIRPWIERKHGELGFHLTQLLTGHGVFGSFLKKIKEAEDDTCWYGCEWRDDPEHTLMYCEHWHEEREELEEALGIEDSVTPEECMRKALESRKKWEALEKFCGTVMKSKEDDERCRTREMHRRRMQQN